jgi:glycosyltransferase involved in cell wall biosynthesis
MNPAISTTHLVLIPSYNTGPKLVPTVLGALRVWSPVWVVVDGSTDSSDTPLAELATREPGLRVITRPRNGGKGEAVRTGLAAAAAAAAGFTHVLTMDSDGQHPAERIGDFMAASQRAPAAMVLGVPIFDASVPRERLHGRKLSVAMAALEIGGQGITDPLFGFRVYPVGALAAVLTQTRRARGFDFDPEVVVRLFWRGVPTINLPASCRYFARNEGGVSHFNYLRDNAKLVWMHTRLMLQLLLWRWPGLLRARRAMRVAGFLSALALVVGVGPGGTGRCLAGPRGPSDSPQTTTPSEPAAPEPRLDPASLAPEWTPILDSLRARERVRCAFTESRKFPLRAHPVELGGELRVDLARGLSLGYSSPEARTVIVDAMGILIRVPGLADRAAPEDARATRLQQALWQVLRFDLAALAPWFEITGEVTAEQTWWLRLEPKGDAALAPIEVAGRLGAVERIVIRPRGLRIEITAGAPIAVGEWSEAEAREFFR